MHMRSKEIAAWLRGRVSIAGADGLVVGLSGRVESAVVARLCQMAMPDRVAGVVLPCQSDPRDEEDALLVADHFHVPVVRADLGPVFHRLATDLQSALSSVPRPRPRTEEGDDAPSPLAHLKPRLRMASLNFVAKSLNYLVAGTGNRCEIALGYFSPHGDGAADVLPLGGLLKSDVCALARDLDVPASIMDRDSSDGSWLPTSGERERGFSYADLEHYLADGPDGVAPAVALRIERLMRTSEQTRAVPPTPDGE